MLKGIDEIKEGLRKIENGEIKVVREKQFSSLECEISEVRREEAKYWSYYDETEEVCGVIEVPSNSALI